MFSESGGKLNAGGLVSLSKSLQLILFSCLKVKVCYLYQWSTIMARALFCLRRVLTGWCLSPLHLPCTHNIPSKLVSSSLHWTQYVTAGHNDKGSLVSPPVSGGGQRHCRGKVAIIIPQNYPNNHTSKLSK